MELILSQTEHPRSEGIFSEKAHGTTPIHSGVDAEKSSALSALLSDRMCAHHIDKKPHYSNIPEKFIPAVITELNKFSDELSDKIHGNSLKDIDLRAKEIKESLIKEKGEIKSNGCDIEGWSEDLNNALGISKNGTRTNLLTCVNDLKRCMVEQKQLMRDFIIRGQEPGHHSPKSDSDSIHLKKTSESFDHLLNYLDTSYTYDQYVATLNKFELTAALFSDDPHFMKSHLNGRTYSDHKAEFDWVKSNNKHFRDHPPYAMHGIFTD